MGDDAEIFLTPDGCLYHLGVKEGEIYPRILTVGDRERAEIIASKFLKDVKEYEKSRNFRTFSGLYKGVPVSVVSIGMGSPNMDFLVREVSYLFKSSNLIFVRLGTCGIFKKDIPVGTLCLSDQIYYCQRNYGYFDGWVGDVGEGCGVVDRPYFISGPVKGDEELIDKIQQHLQTKQVEFRRGKGITAETFYSCQGRRFPGFVDENGNLLKEFVDLGVLSCEMESYQLYHLSRQRALTSSCNTTDLNNSNNNNINNNNNNNNNNNKERRSPNTRAASICLGVVNRVDPNSPSHLVRKSEDATKQIILEAAEAALEALISFSV